MNPGILLATLPDSFCFPIPIFQQMQKTRVLWFVVLTNLGLIVPGHGQPRTDSLLSQLMARNPDALFQEVIQHPDKYRLQIIYTRIDRDRQNKPTFTDFRYHVDSTCYFNPASTVKLTFRKINGSCGP